MQDNDGVLQKREEKSRSPNQEVWSAQNSFVGEDVLKNILLNVLKEIGEPPTQLRNFELMELHGHLKTNSIHWN